VFRRWYDCKASCHKFQNRKLTFELETVAFVICASVVGHASLRPRGFAGAARVLVDSEQGRAAMTIAHINRVAVAVPAHEMHETFVRFAGRLLHDRRARLVFDRMVSRSQIERRWSCLAPAGPGNNASVDDGGFYTLGRFPSTAQRMARYETEAPALAAAAVDRLDLGDAAREVTHLIVTSCTGLSAPGLDLGIVRRCGLDAAVERTVIGFMGCYAAITALKLARHIVRSEPSAKVLVVSVELCTLHLQETEDLDRLLTFLLFGDGASAALVSAAPVGLALNGFNAVLVQEAADQITWSIRDLGFDMVLSGRVPGTINEALRAGAARVLPGLAAGDIALWAVHPGGRTVLDAVEGAFGLDAPALAASRAVLRDYGNMSSPTVMFVLERLLNAKAPAGARGCAMAFGPGLTAETMLFRAAA
jgi:alpha-pyrone synthase